MNDRIRQIRERERESHTLVYKTDELYGPDGWLKKLIKTVQDIVAMLDDRSSLRVLDLGSGVGRNSIFIARSFREKKCVIDCVDLLEIAIDKLRENVKANGVVQAINGAVGTIEGYKIVPNTYDLIMAISALEHVEDEACFLEKLMQIWNGIKKDGFVCLVINTEVCEFDIKTRERLEPQFEVNLPTTKVFSCLDEVFYGWDVVKRKVSGQIYHVPRGGITSELNTKVVTFVARKVG